MNGDDQRELFCPVLQKFSRRFCLIGFPPPLGGKALEVRIVA